jgi:hypothetical protein
VDNAREPFSEGLSGGGFSQIEKIACSSNGVALGQAGQGGGDFAPAPDLVYGGRRSFILKATRMRAAKRPTADLS